MKRQWKVKRKQQTPDAWQRWDRGYQLLLRWAQTAEQAQKQEVKHDCYSGANLSRLGLAALRSSAASGEMTHLLVTAPDRLARNYSHQMLLLEALDRAGCEVVFLERSMSHDPHDQWLLQIRGAVAEYERSLAERMRRGRLVKLKAGLLLPWTRPAYG